MTLRATRTTWRAYAARLSRTIAVAIAVIAIVGCSGKPSASDVELAVRTLLPEEIPTMLLVQSSVKGDSFARCQMPGLHDVEIHEVRVLEIGKPWKWTVSWPYTMHYPAKVYVDCVCVEGGERHRIKGAVDVDLGHASDGKWWVRKL